MPRADSGVIGSVLHDELRHCLTTYAQGCHRGFSFWSGKKRKSEREFTKHGLKMGAGKQKTDTQITTWANPQPPCLSYFSPSYHAS